MDTYLTYLDQLRYYVGLVGTILLVCHGILPPKKNYRVRLGLSCWIGLLSVMSYIPLYRIVSAAGIDLLVVSIIYWVLMSIFPIVMIFVCWEASPAGIFFRAIVSIMAENFMTAISYYMFVKCLFPDFPKEHPGVYFVLLFIFYAFIFFLGKVLIRKRVTVDENSFYQDPKKTFRSFLYIYITIHLLINFTKLCFEFIVAPLETSEEYRGIFLFLHNYLTVNLVLISVVISFVMLSAYHALIQRNEQQLIMQMVRDREAQYEFSRESMEMVKRQAHDLKHRLKALEQVAPEERQKELIRANRSVDFFDSVFRTGHEALDTILTEKNIYCMNRSIRLSCNVRSRQLEKIRTVDLYVLLGNALDNAIEAVDKLDDPEKKTITLTVRDQDEMLFIQVENYYEGELTMEDGLPLTTKSDEMNHGFGTKSIRAIVKSYGGASMIRTENHIFSLEILIPT